MHNIYRTFHRLIPFRGIKEFLVSPRLDSCPRWAKIVSMKRRALVGYGIFIEYSWLMPWIIWLDYNDLTRRHGRIRGIPCGVKSTGFSKTVQISGLQTQKKPCRLLTRKRFLTSHYMSPRAWALFSKHVVFEVFAPQKRSKKSKKERRFWENLAKLDSPQVQPEIFGVADPKTCRSLARKRLWRKPLQRPNDLKQFVISCDLNLISVFEKT